MDNIEINSELRDMFNDLINDGFLKFHLCKIVLGSQRNAQFENLLQGKLLGIQPLNQIFKNLGYSLNLVPIPHNNNKKKEIINDLYNDLFYDIRIKLIEILENTNRKSKHYEMINDMSKQILKEIFENSIDPKVSTVDGDKKNGTDLE